MKTVVKLVMMLAVLAICMPAQGEILIYEKTIRCWDAMEDGPWDVEEFTIRGYLILDVTRVNGDVIVNNAAQVEFGKEDGDKWYDVYTEDFGVIRVENDEVEWVLVYGDTGENEGQLTMVRGRARDINVGYGNDNKREVPRQLSGYTLILWTGNGDWLAMCEWRLRLKTKWTKDINEEEGDIGDAVNMIADKLERRGYEGGA